MAPRVGFEPTTNRLTAGCSTTELPRNTFAHGRSERGLYQVRRRGKSPDCALEHSTQRKTRAPFGALEGVGYGGVSPREDAVNMILTGKHTVNGERRFTKPANVLSLRGETASGWAWSRRGAR